MNNKKNNVKKERRRKKNKEKKNFYTAPASEKEIERHRKMIFNEFLTLYVQHY